MNWISIFFFFLGGALIGMGLLSRKWKQASWPCQAFAGLFMLAVGVWQALAR